MNQPKKDASPAAEQPAVIAHRKSCDPTGTGLSHYVLLDAEVPAATETAPAPAKR